MFTVFQITKEMVERSSTLEKEDIGLWCFLVRGRYHGFCSTKGEAYLKAKDIFKEQVVLRDQIEFGVTYVSQLFNCQSFWEHLSVY